MPSVANLASHAEHILQFTGKPDGIVVLAYPGETGGAGERLLQLIKAATESLPVLVVQHGSPEFGGSSPRFRGNNTKVQGVPKDPGREQNASIMSAMRELGIQNPILIMLDLSFARFWERAFAAGRFVAITDTFHRETDTAEENAESELINQDQILLLERSVHGVLVNDDADLEWLKTQFIYLGEFLKIGELGDSPCATLQEFSTERLGRESRFPHRLDILIIVDDPGEGRHLHDNSVTAHYQHDSRHNIYFSLKKTAAPSGDSVVDYTAFDVVLICMSSADSADQDLDPRVTGGLKNFPGLKGVITAGSNINGVAIQHLVESTGCHVSVPEQSMTRQRGAPETLDRALSSLMPGLPNLLLHKMGYFVPPEASTHQNLVRRHASGEFEISFQGNPLGTLRSIASERQATEERLNEMRTEIASQNEKIAELKERNEATKVAKLKETGKRGRFLKQLLSKIHKRTRPGNR